MAKIRAGLRYGLEYGRTAFEKEIPRRHKELQTRLHKYMLNARPLVVLTAPFIYSPIIPFVLIDLSVMLYQVICFPAYGIEKIRRRDYFVFDRPYFAYLNGLEKLNCPYCFYAGGAIAFLREVAARTEQDWCPIKQARKVVAAHEHDREFLDFGDAKGCRDRIASSAAERNKV